MTSSTVIIIPFSDWSEERKLDPRSNLNGQDFTRKSKTVETIVTVRSLPNKKTNSLYFTYSPNKCLNSCFILIFGSISDQFLAQEKASHMSHWEHTFSEFKLSASLAKNTVVFFQTLNSFLVPMRTSICTIPHQKTIEFTWLEVFRKVASRYFENCCSL